MSMQNPRIRYDTVGNIILLGGEERNAACAIPSTSTLSLPWPSLSTVLGAMGARMRGALQSSIAESALQYRWTFSDIRGITQRMTNAAYKGTSALLMFLCQPVWIPGRRGVPKQYSRAVLFLLDTVRFGATFAAIFSALFLTLNYRSFWDIASTAIDPLAALSARAPTERIRDVLLAGTHRPTAQAGDLSQFLPPVGPPTNRLLIPSLGLNVPIATPPHDALLTEDWERLEEDIQKALESGVVHYPGTARPGQGGNFFLTGHSSYYPWAAGKFKSVFARLPALKVGDEFWIYYNGDRHRFIVQEKKEVQPTDVRVLDQPLDRRIATLMTCVPVGTTLRRLILVSQEVDPITGTPLALGQHGEQPTLLQKNKPEMLPI